MSLFPWTISLNTHLSGRFVLLAEWHLHSRCLVRAVQSDSRGLPEALLRRAGRAVERVRAKSFSLLLLKVQYPRKTGGRIQTQSYIRECYKSQNLQGGHLGCLSHILKPGEPSGGAGGRWQLPWCQSGRETESQRSRSIY